MHASIFEDFVSVNGVVRSDDPCGSVCVLITYVWFSRAVMVNYYKILMKFLWLQWTSDQVYSHVQGTHSHNISDNARLLRFAPFSPFSDTKLNPQFDTWEYKQEVILTSVLHRAKTTSMKREGCSRQSNFSGSIALCLISPCIDVFKWASKAPGESGYYIDYFQGGTQPSGIAQQYAPWFIDHGW